MADTPFIAAYTVDQDRIVILAIYHGAQRWPEGLQFSQESGEVE